MKHKCRVFKYYYKETTPWVTMCSIRDCSLRNGYLVSTTWEEAMLEALHHRMRNQ